MSKTRSRRWILLEILLAMSVIAIAVTARFTISEDMYEPTATSNITYLGIAPEKAVEIAIAEVEKREGWRGAAEATGQEGAIWFVIVRRKPGPTSDWRYIDIGHSGKILDYSVRTDPRE